MTSESRAQHTTRISYREAIEILVARVEGLPEEYERMGYAGIRPRHGSRIALALAASKSLAALVEEAMELAAKDEWPETYSAMAGALLDKFAAGFDPPRATETATPNDNGD